MVRNVSPKNSGMLLVAISAISFGLLPIFAKVAYATGISTYTLLFFRFAISAVFLLALTGIKRLPLPSKKELIALLLLGGIGYAGQSFGYFTALNYASASVVSLLLYTYPALVMVGSVLFLHEQVTGWKVFSLCLALAGAFVIIGGEFQASSVGVFFAVLAAVVYSVYILINSRVVKEGMGIQSSAFISLGAAVVYGGISCFTGFSLPTQPIGFVSVLLIAFVCTVLAIWSFLTGMEKTGASTAALISTLEPVVTVLCSAVLLSEPLTINIVIGGCLVLAALIITALPKKSDS